MGPGNNVTVAFTQFININVNKCAIFGNSAIAYFKWMDSKIQFVKRTQFDEIMYRQIIMKTLCDN